MIVSRGLVGPKPSLNRSWAKGKQVNIPVLALQQNRRFRPTRAALSGCLNILAPRRTVTVRKGVTCDGVSRATPGTREKGAKRPVPRSDTGAPS